MAKPRRGNRIITSPQFFGRLCWLDRRPLLDTMEPYRRDLLTSPSRAATASRKSWLTTLPATYSRPSSKPTAA